MQKTKPKQKTFSTKSVTQITEWSGDFLEIILTKTPGIEKGKDIR